MTVIYTSIYTNPEMKTQCQDYLHYHFFLFLIKAMMWLEK